MNRLTITEEARRLEGPGNPRILLIHGFLSGSRAWSPLQRHLSGVAETVTVDLPGYGSAAGQDPGDGLEALVARLVPLVERERPTHLLGHSMGAIVSLALAARLPGRFERVGLVGLPVFASRTEAVAHLRRHSPLRRFALLNDSAAHAGCSAAQSLRRVWHPLVPLLASPVQRERILCLFDHSLAGHAGCLQQIVFAGHVETLAGDVPVPVAALHGGEDRVAPLRPVRALSRKHGWDLRVAPSANHQVPIERPALVARWVRESLLAPT